MTQNKQYMAGWQQYQLVAHTTGEPRSKSHRDGLVCSEEESGALGQAEEQGPADRQHLTPQVYRNYIGHFKRVVPVVVEKGGKASGIWPL